MGLVSPRTRIVAIITAAAAVAVLATVALAVVTGGKKEGQKEGQPLAGAPPLALELGVRTDLEARSLRRAQGLYNKGQRAAAGRIFVRDRSTEAQVGSAFAAWPDGSLARIQRLAREHPTSLVLLHLGYAELWSGNREDANAAWTKASRAQPDSSSAQRADDALHPDFPAGQPFFVPSFNPPNELTGLSAPRQLAALSKAAQQPDVHAKLLYGIAQQRLGHRLSARRQYDAAARLAPNDPEAQVAAAVGRFDKGRPSAAFSRLGPLTQRFPQAATVRFHLGVLLLWLARAQPGSVKEGKRQLRLARTEEPGSPLAREATRLLNGLEDIETG